MDLRQHKAAVFAYEAKLRELRALKAVQPQAEWVARVDRSYNDDLVAEVPLPKEYAHKLLKEYITQVEQETKDMAARLGVEYEELK